VARGEEGLTHIASTTKDPPDCEAIGPAGERVGVEVTELVDQSLAGQRPMTTRPKFWEVPEVVTRLDEIIRRKDEKCRHVTGFARLMLLIHTDEMFLRGYAGDDIFEGVRDTVFDYPNRIDEAVFMVSYDARIQSYPFVRLKFSTRHAG
jgi:hypothetical protein